MIIASPQSNTVEVEDLSVFTPRFGQFRLSIKHTARTWGADMESLITNQINSILQPNSEWRSFLRKNNMLIGFMASLIFILSSLVSAYLSIEATHKKEVHDAMALANGSQDANKKINFLINYVVSNSQDTLSSKTGIYLIVSFIIAAVLGIWVGGLADDKRISHLVLTRESVKNLGLYNEKIKHKTTWFFVSILVILVAKCVAAAKSIKC